MFRQENLRWRHGNVKALVAVRLITKYPGIQMETKQILCGFSIIIQQIIIQPYF